MFCPTINGDCVGETCRDWDKETEQCVIQSQKSVPQLFQEAVAQYEEKMTRIIQMLEIEVERAKFLRLWDRLNLKRILADPTTPADIKQVIEQAFETPSPDIAEKLLKDAGLID